MKQTILLAALGLLMNLNSMAFAVTFRVDMSNVTGFNVANVNGTFNNWCGACAPMTDANGDGIWEITINLNAGNYQYKFTYNGWTGQENLTPGSSCTVTQSGFTNRTLAVTGDVVLPVVCYGACTSCAQVLPSYPVTFKVDMNQQSGFTTPEVNGTFNNWCGNCASMTDANGDGIWEKTITLQQGTYEYKFAADNWATQENLIAGSACTNTTGNFTNRTLNVTGPTTLNAVCWGSCSACSAPPVNVTFQVDMNQYTGNFTTPEVNGTFNSWCGNCNPMTDANGDNVWEVTLPLQTGTYEYKFAHDNWTGQEAFTPGTSCTVTANGFTNRVVVISGPTTLDLVCWESCAACVNDIPGCTDASAANYNSSATSNDGSCLYTTSFNVDMSCSGTPFTNAYVTGPWCNWCGAELYNLLTDPDGNGIYSGNVQLAAGNIEYKYMVDGWASQENLLDDVQAGASCAPVTDYATYANRSGVVGNTFNDTYGQCVSCGTVLPTPCDLYTQNFNDSSSLVGWSAVADANSPEASLSWDATGALRISGSNTSPSIGKAYIFEYLNNTLNYNGNSSVELVFDIKAETQLTGTALHLQTEFPGTGVTNTFDIQNAGINTSTWTHYSYTFNNVGTATLFRMHFNLAAGAFVGAGGTLLIDNIELNCYTPVAIQGCTDPTATNYNAAATADDGSCIYPVTYNVTFQVDMQNVTGFSTPEVNGNFNGWCGGCAPMTDANGDNIWELTIPLSAGNYEYKFAYDSWAGQETLLEGSSCTVTNFGYTNRSLSVSSDVTLPVVCWSSCSDCGSSIVPVNVTFQVDMSQYTGSFTTPEVNGTFNGWCGNCNPLSDLNGDNIWETTIALLPGNYEYKFSHDTWTGQEELTPGSTCTITTGGFTNRSLVLSSDTTLQTVCWASCNACESLTENNFYFYSSGKCENWIISVNMYVNGIISGSVLFDNGLETDTVETNSGLPIGGYINTMNNSTFTLEILAEDIFGNIITLYGDVSNGIITSNEFPSVPFPITANNPITLDCGAVSELGTQVTAFPNPTNGMLNIITEMALPINYTILDLSGRIVQSGISNQRNFQLSLGNNSEGIYQLQLQNNSELKSIKLLIEK